MSLVQHKIHALLLALAVAIATISFAASSAFAQDKVVWSLGGSNEHTSETVTTTGPIEIRWRATGGQFQMSILDATTNVELMAGPPQKRTEDEQPAMVGGITTVRGGDIVFKITASGPWFVRAVER